MSNQQNDIYNEFREENKPMDRTPLPWKFETVQSKNIKMPPLGKDFFNVLTYDFKDGNKSIVCMAQVPELPEESEANFRFMETACNLHDELIEAINFLLSPHDYDKSHNAIDCKLDPCAYCFAKQVLAKAEGKA